MNPKNTPAAAPKAKPAANYRLNVTGDARLVADARATDIGEQFKGAADVCAAFDFEKALLDLGRTVPITR